MRILRKREVDQAIKAVIREVKAAVKEMNAEAGNLLARGKYDKATAMVETCRRIGEFQGKVAALRKDWQTLRKCERAPAEKQEATPTWKFYKPIALALIQLQGQAKRDGLERQLGTLLDGQLLPGDLVADSRGLPRWKISVRSARGPMMKEGFLEQSKGGWWRLTEAGRKMAEKPDVTSPGRSV
jgi:hypothetical protein